MARSVEDGVRDLLHRLSTVIQLALGLGCVLALQRWSSLGLVFSAVIALPVSVFGTYALMLLADVVASDDRAGR